MAYRLPTALENLGELERATYRQEILRQMLEVLLRDRETRILSDAELLDLRAGMALLDRLDRLTPDEAERLARLEDFLAAAAKR